MKKALVAILGALVVLVGGGLGFLFLARPLVRPASAETFEPTPERVARGKYLVHHVADCLTCHSEFDTEHYSLPPKAGTLGSGGFCFTSGVKFSGFQIRHYADDGRNEQDQNSHDNLQ